MVDVPIQVLDLDLDFFLTDVAHFFSDYERRLDPSRYEPWKIHEVRLFLEKNCGLSTVNRCKGKVVEHHNEVFWALRELVGKGKIGVPFEVVHIDAHADLGNGDATYIYVMTELLHKPVADRVHPDPGQVRPGNYLVYLLACRWISRMKLGVAISCQR